MWSDGELSETVQEAIRSTCPEIGELVKLCIFLCKYRRIQTPRATNYGEFCKIYSNDVYLQFEFLEGSFPQFKEMGGFEKKHVFKYFFVSFLILEMGYRSYQEGTDAIVLANGDFIDTMNLDEFYYDPESLEKCKPTDAMK